MGLTKKGKILLTSLATLIGLASIAAFAVSIEKKHQLQLPRQKSGIARLLDIKDSLSRARDKMEELVDTNGNGQELERSRRDVGILTHLREAVNHLSKSLSDFAEVLNQTGFDNILSRYEKDLENFTKILNEIESNNGTVSSENLEQVKIIEQLFFEDETDLMKTETITADQAEAAGTVVETLERTENLTNLVIEVIDEAMENQNTNVSVNNTAELSTSLNETIDVGLSTTVIVSVISTSDDTIIEATTEISTSNDVTEATTEILTSEDNITTEDSEIVASSEDITEDTTDQSDDSSEAES